MCAALVGFVLFNFFGSIVTAYNSTRKNASSVEQHSPISEKLNLMILPLSAALFFLGLLVSRCYCWMVQDIREHDRTMDNVFSNHSLRREHQAVVEKVTSRRIHRLLKRGYSYSDELVNYMYKSSQSFDPLSERNCSSVGADLTQNDVKLVKWLDEVNTQLPTSTPPFHFSLSYPSSFISSRSPPPLHTRSFPALSRIPEDTAVGIEKVEPLLPNTDSTSLTICSSEPESSGGEFSDRCESEI